MQQVQALLLLRVREGMKILNREIVRQFLDGEISSLSEYEIINREAAALLAQYPGDLTLDGLKDLAAPAAGALSAYRGRLSLAGLQVLSPETADALGNHYGGLLLSNLKTASVRVAKALARHRGAMVLGVKELTADARQALVGRPDIYLPKALLIQETKEADASSAKIEEAFTLTKSIARSFLEGKPENLSKYTAIDFDAADILKRCDGELILDGLITLPDAVAAVLATHNGWLSLDGLKNLSSAAAKSLATHRGILSLGGLSSLTDELAVTLAEHQGELYLQGLQNLSPSVLLVLRSKKDAIFPEALARPLQEPKEAKVANISEAPLPKKILTKEIAQRYLEEEDIDLEGFATIKDAAASLFAKYNGHLDLRGLETLSDSAAAALANHKGRLRLDGLTTLSDAAVAALARHDGWINLDGLLGLSDAAAAALAEHKGRLYLRGVTALSDRAATFLAKHPGELILDGLETLSDIAALALAGHKGRLRLGAIETLSDTVAKALGRHQGDLRLNALEALSDNAATSLAKHQGDLRLNSLATLSDAAAETLAKHKGDLYLEGLEKLAPAALAALSGKPHIYLPESLAEATLKLPSESGNTAQDATNDGGEIPKPSGPQKIITKEIAQRYLAGKNIEANSSEAIDDAAAEALAEHEGAIDLSGLETLSNATDAGLFRKEDRVSLNNELHEVSPLSNPLQTEDPLTALCARAEEGEVRAQFDLAQKYDEGLGVPQDFAKAFTWYRLAAEQDFLPAQTILGIKYALGEGIGRDDVESERWLKRAAAQHFDFAEQALETVEARRRLEQDLRDIAVKSAELSPVGNTLPQQKVENEENGLGGDELLNGIRYAYEKTMLAEIFERFELEPVIENYEKNKIQSHRDEILATTLKLTKHTSPRLIGLLNEVVAKLRFHESIELFVEADSSINAYVVYSVDDAPHSMVLTSAMVERMNDKELRFVLGHEIGHLRYRHYQAKLLSPVFADSDVEMPRLLKRRLTTWNRLAEISADRAGYAAVNGDLKSIVSVFFKLESGLGPEHLHFDVAAFLEQLEDLQHVERGALISRFSHPLTPIRVRALHLFGEAGAVPRGLASVDEAVKALVALMEYAPTTPLEVHAKDFILAAGILIVRADGDFSQEEHSMLVDYLLPLVGDPEAGIKEIKSIAQANKMMAASADWLNKNTGQERFNIFDMLARLAVIDGELHDKEARRLLEVADALKIPRVVAKQTMHDALVANLQTTRSTGVLPSDHFDETSD